MYVLIWIGSQIKNVINAIGTTKTPVGITCYELIVGLFAFSFTITLFVRFTNVLGNRIAGERIKAKRRNGSDS
jgi:hypothetical protein